MDALIEFELNCTLLNKETRFDPSNSHYQLRVFLKWNYLLTHFTSLRISRPANCLNRKWIKVKVNCMMSLFPLFLLPHRDFGWTPLGHHVPPLLYFPAKCPRAAPWRRFTWMGSPPPLAWWRWEGTQSWVSALWRAVRNRWWSALSRQVGVVLCWL